ncbi:FlgD immunoglobulin-like domain containing protein [Candidatus Latescibacterota bacterium]
MKKIVFILFIAIFYAFPVLAQNEINTIDIILILPDGTSVPLGSVKEGNTLSISELPAPFDYLNGTGVSFPEECISKNITITIKIPDFAEIDVMTGNVSFGEIIISGINIWVSVDGETVSQFTFDVPIVLTIPYDSELLASLEIDPENLDMFYYTESGKLVKEGITDVVVNSETNVITGNIAHFSDIAVAPKSAGPTAVEENTLPDGFMLSQNFPNPFNPETTISYRLPETSFVKIDVYSVIGQLVRTLVNEIKSAGNYTVTWDGKDNAGSQLRSGVYFYRIKAGDYKLTRKLMLIK